MSDEEMSKTLSKPMSINDLPNEVLVPIFNCLDIQTKLRAEQVCRKWREIVGTCLAVTNRLFIYDSDIGLNAFADSKRYRNTDVVCRPEMWLSLDRDWDRFSLKSLMSRYPNLKALHLSLTEEDIDLKRNVLRLIARTVDSDLQEISLTFNNLEVKVHSSEVSKFCEKYPNVRRFEVESLELYISEWSVEMMIKMWPKLEALLIYSCNDDFLRAFVKSPRHKSYFADISANIQWLRMPGFMLTETAVRELAKRAVKLEKLETYYVTNGGVNSINGTKVICDCLQSITSFNCYVFERQYDQSYATILMSNISKLNSLKELSLTIDSHEQVLTSDSIEYLKRCSQLRSLSIEDSYLTAECIEALRLSVPNLLSLTLRNVTFDSVSDARIAPIKPFKHLTSLTLRTKPHLTDKSLTEILESSKTLRRLDVSRDCDVSVTTVSAVIKIANSIPEETIHLTVNSAMKESCAELSIPKNLVIKFR